MLIKGDDFVDLHLHTRANDGRWTPAGLAEAAQNLALRVLAVTDHDTTASVKPLIAEAAQRGLHVIPGVEVNVSWRNNLYHLLLYKIDLDDPGLQQMLGDLWSRHKARAGAARANLERQGITLPPEAGTNLDGELLPVLLINAVIGAGYASDYHSALKVLGDPGIIASAVPLETAVAVAHAQGALAVLAHPGRVEVPTPTVTPEALLEMLGDAPLDGIEAHYSLYGPLETERYNRFAADHGLLVTCGSDCHGPRDRRPLRQWPAELCREFLSRCGVTVR